MSYFLDPDYRPSPAEMARDEDFEPHCRCRHDTSNPELGCTCGYADAVGDGLFDEAVAEPPTCPKGTRGCTLFDAIHVACDVAEAGW